MKTASVLVGNHGEELALTQGEPKRLEGKLFRARAEQQEAAMVEALKKRDKRD